MSEQYTTKLTEAKSKDIDYLMEKTINLCEDAKDERTKLESLKFLNELLSQKFYVRSVEEIDNFRKWLS